MLDLLADTVAELLTPSGHTEGAAFGYAPPRRARAYSQGPRGCRRVHRHPGEPLC